MAPRVVEVEFRVSDLDRSLRFYRDLIGVPLEKPETHEGEGIRHAHASWGAWGKEGFLLFNLYPARSGEETRASISFQIDSLDATHARLQDAGVEVLRPPERKPWGWSATYRDPDGNTISLIESPR